MFWSKTWICVVTAVALFVCAGSLLAIAPLGERLNEETAARLVTAQRAFLAILVRDHQAAAAAAAPITNDVRIADALDQATRAAADLPMIRESLLRYLEKQRADLHADVLIALDVQQRIIADVGVSAKKGAELPEPFKAAAVAGTKDPAFLRYGDVLLYASAIPIRFHDRFAGALVIGTRVDTNYLTELAGALAVDFSVFDRDQLIAATKNAPAAAIGADILRAPSSQSGASEVVERDGWLVLSGTLSPASPPGAPFHYLINHPKTEVSAVALLSTLWQSRGSVFRLLPTSSLVLLFLGALLAIGGAFLTLAHEAPARRARKTLVDTPTDIDSAMIMSADSIQVIDTTENPLSEVSEDAPTHATRLPESVAPPPPSARPWTPRGAPPPLPKNDASDAMFREVFREFVETRHRQGEPVEGLSYDKFIEKLRANRAELINLYDCKEVKFQVYVKDGKTKLKATPIVDG